MIMTRDEEMNYAWASGEKVCVRMCLSTRAMLACSHAKPEHKTFRSAPSESLGQQLEAHSIPSFRDNESQIKTRHRGLTKLGQI